MRYNTWITTHTSSTFENEMQTGTLREAADNLIRSYGESDQLVFRELYADDLRIVLARDPADGQPEGLVIIHQEAM